MKDNLLGRDAAVQLKLIALIDGIDVFGKIGVVKDRVVSIKLKVEEQVYCTSNAHWIPFLQLSKVKTELESMESMSLTR